MGQPGGDSRDPERSKAEDDRPQSWGERQVRHPQGTRHTLPSVESASRRYAGRPVHDSGASAVAGSTASPPGKPPVRSSFSARVLSLSGLDRHSTAEISGRPTKSVARGSVAASLQGPASRETVPIRPRSQRRMSASTSMRSGFRLWRYRRRWRSIAVWSRRENRAQPAFTTRPISAWTSPADSRMAGVAFLCPMAGTGL